MMQFKLGVRPLVFMALIGVAGCNTWFDYAPKGALPNPSPETKAQTCPAGDLQYLVGQSRRVLETMRFGSEVRIEEPGQMYTLDYKATRTRIVIGGDGKISRILCG